MCHSDVERPGRHSADDETVAHADAGDISRQTSEEPVVVAGAESESTAVSIERQPGYQHRADLIEGHDRCIDGRLLVTEPVRFAWAPTVVDGEFVPRRRCPSQRKHALGNVGEQWTQIGFAWHGIERDDPPGYVSIKETTHGDTYPIMIDLHCPSICLRSTTQRPLGIIDCSIIDRAIVERSMLTVGRFAFAHSSGA